MKTIDKLPEHFVYNDDNFCSDLGELMDILELDEDDVRKLPEDWTETISETKIEPIHVLEVEEILENCIPEDRLSEDGDELERLKKSMQKHINFDAINKEMPMLYYSTGFEYKVTKNDLLDYIN